MHPDLTILGVAIPTVLASAIAALFTFYLNYRATKEFKAIESDLKRQEEAYRLAQSPRVTAAVRLWVAYCEYERSVSARVSPVSIVTEPETGTREEKEDAMKKQRREQDRAKHAAVVAGWDVLKRARDEAECLLDDTTFTAFDALYEECDAAHREVWVTDFYPDDHKARALAVGNAMKKLESVKAKRAAVVAAMRTLISGK